MRIKLKIALTVFAAAALLSCSGEGGKNKGKKVPPHILFIAIDDLNDWTTLFDPNNPIQTPNLVRLAGRGMFFTRGYCAAPACNPSRTAIMTGLMPSSSGIYNNGQSRVEIIPDQVVLPQYLNQYGYATNGAGKIYHHGRPGDDDPDNPSFEKFFKMLPARAPEKNYNGYTELEAPLNRVWFDWGEHDQKMIDIDMVEYIEAVMDEQWDRPTFLAAGIFKPHLPFYAPAENFKKYPKTEMVFPLQPEDDLEDVPEIAKRMAHTEPFFREHTGEAIPWSAGSYERLVQCYQASADFADQMVGRLLDKLDANGRADNTIIVLWADHGYHLGDKESFVKFTLWEKANHVPFIIVAPGISSPGTTCAHPVSLIDIYPTLLDLAGLPAKENLDGQSLVPLLKDPEMDWERPAIMTHGRGNHAVRTKRWRYIRYSDGSEELYDHNIDPWEWTNLANKSGFDDVKASHQKWLPTTEVQRDK